MAKMSISISLEYADLQTIANIQRDKRFKSRSEAVQWILQQGFNRIMDLDREKQAQILGKQADLQQQQQQQQQ